MSLTVRLRAASGAETTKTLPDPVVTGQQQSVNVGETAILSRADSGNGNKLCGQKVTFPAGGLLQSLSFYVRVVGGQLRLGVYSDSPDALVAQSAAFTPVLGWNTVALSVPVGGVYWLAHLPSSNQLGTWVGSGGQLRYRSQTFGAMPATFGTSSMEDNHWSFYATVLAGSSSPPPPPPPPPPPSGLPALWNASPPTGICPAPAGPIVGASGEFDTGVLVSTEMWDNFDGAAGSNPDSRLWLEDTINQGGTQVYNPAQSFLDGSGHAVLEATKSGSQINSGRFTSRSKWNMQYGWCAVRAKLPMTQGSAGKSWFPALWMLAVGYNTGTPYAEIDIVEQYGNSSQYSSHLYFANSVSVESAKACPVGNAANDFHTYWMDWRENRIQIGVDDLIVATWTPADGGNWAGMNFPHYWILNFAVHPSFLPAPADSDFPCDMLIDWVWYKPLGSDTLGSLPITLA